MRMKTFLAVSVLAAFCGTDAFANLTLNPGFESGDFTNWSVFSPTPYSTFEVVNSFDPANPGSFNVDPFPFGGIGGLQSWGPTEGNSFALFQPGIEAGTGAGGGFITISGDFTVTTNGSSLKFDYFLDAAEGGGAGNQTFTFIECELSGHDNRGPFVMASVDPQFDYDDNPSWQTHTVTNLDAGNYTFTINVNGGDGHDLINTIYGLDHFRIEAPGGEGNPNIIPAPNSALAAMIGLIGLGGFHLRRQKGLFA